MLIRTNNNNDNNNSKPITEIDKIFNEFPLDFNADNECFTLKWYTLIK